MPHRLHDTLPAENLGRGERERGEPFSKGFPSRTASTPTAFSQSTPSKLRIGLDCDNTLIAYDGLFHALALDAGLISPETARTKTAVRDAVRGLPGGEISWQRLQAAAYGPRLSEAALFPGVKDFLALARRSGAMVCIVSHKTRFASQGTDDLHGAARRFLHQRGLLCFAADQALSEHSDVRTMAGAPGSPESADIGVVPAAEEGFFRPETVFFETSRRAKLERIAALGLDMFVDDLPEVLCDPLFPPGTRRVLFTPGDGVDVVVPEAVQAAGGIAVASYAALSRLVFGTAQKEA